MVVNFYLGERQGGVPEAPSSSAKGAEGGGCEEGCIPPTVGMAWGGSCARPQKIF